jgi:hypothetical protein
VEQLDAAQTATVPAHRESRIAGRWYYLVLVLTAGLFAWVPFVHAAVRLGTAKARRLAVIFGAVDVALYVLLSLAPQDPQTTTDPLSTIGGLLALATTIVGCIMVGPLRRMVYEGAPIADTPAGDPAVASALAARARRVEAKKLVADDPLLARELNIGRPDRLRTYDDGGLVDLNNAPTDAIATVCGIPLEMATRIAAARTDQGEPFANVDEVLVMVDLPVSTWDVIRDRGVLLP